MEEKTLLRIKVSNWSTLITLLFFLIFSLMISSLVTPRWVRQGARDTIWRGSLLRCGGCIGEWEDKYYFSISKISDSNNVRGFYTTFNSLYISGLIFLVFETLSLILMTIIFLLKLNVFNNKLSHRVYFCFNICIFVLHTVGLISWFAISKAKYFTECSKSSDYFKAESICATNGPTIAIITEFFIVLNLIVKILLWNKESSINSVASCSTSRIEKVNIVTDQIQ